MKKMTDVRRLKDINPEKAKSVATELRVLPEDITLVRKYYVSEKSEVEPVNSKGEKIPPCGVPSGVSLKSCPSIMPALSICQINVSSFLS